MKRKVIVTLQAECEVEIEVDVESEEEEAVTVENLRKDEKRAATSKGQSFPAWTVVDVREEP